MFDARRVFLFKGGDPRRKCCDEGPAGEPPACVVPVVTAFAPAYVDVGSAISITAALTSGTHPGVWSFATPVAGLTIDSVIGLISGTMGSSVITANVVYTNACGTDTKTLTINPVAVVVPHNIRWGNFDAPGFPTAAPTFVASDFTGGNANYTSGQISDSSTLAGTYAFPDDGPRLQVMWIADAVTPTSGRVFTVDGFPWGLNPSANTHRQLLTIAGVAGKVYVTTYQNAAYSVVAS